MIKRLMLMAGMSYAGNEALNGTEAARLSTGVHGATPRRFNPEYGTNWTRQFGVLANRHLASRNESGRLERGGIRDRRDSSRAAGMTELSTRALILRAPFA